MKMLQKHGVKCAIITGRESRVVNHRIKNLGIDEQYVYQGQHDKRQGFADLLEKTGLQREQVGYVGDDVVDLPVMMQVGLAIAVNDAHPLVLKHAHWQTPRAGGHGAARDICEMILEARGVLQQELDSYLV